MRKNKKRQYLIIILSIALLLSSLSPAGTVYAAGLQDMPGTGMELVGENGETGQGEGTQKAEEAETAPYPTESAKASVSPDAEETSDSGQTPDSTEASDAAQTPAPTLTPTPLRIPDSTDSSDTEEGGEGSFGEAETPAPLATPETAETPEPTEAPEQTQTPFPTQTPTQSPSGDEAASEEEPDYILGRPMTQEELEAQKALIPDDLPELPEEKTVEAYDSDIALFALMEEEYDSRDYGYITSVKNQNPYGICWSYASIASLESSLVSKGIADASDIDLSEWHLAYYATHTGADALGNTADDYVKESADSTGYMNTGGNAQMAAVALSNWKGAALEEAYPGSTDKTELEAAGAALTANDAWQQDAYYMTNCYMTPSADTESVKKLIKAFGAVYGSYYQSYSYYNAETAAYYCAKTTSTNHAITVVGWNDNYSKRNFITVPEGDGAWICKNSWGSSFGDEGYFYISYYDTSFSSGNVAAFEGERADSFLNNYYYSGGVDIARYISVMGIAQCYTAAANEDGAEKMEGVGFYTYSSGVGYSIQIYKNPDMADGMVTDPQSGEPMLDYPESGVTTYAGYYSVDFSQAVTVEEGDVFSVVITFDKSTAIMVDTTSTLSSGGTVVYDSVNVTAPGESFAKTSSYGQYITLYQTDGGYTPRMNVITRDVEGAGDSFAVYTEEAENVEEIGSFSTWAKAVEAIEAADHENKNYRIEIMQDAAVKGGFILPEGINSLVIAGANPETDSNVILRIGNEIQTEYPLLFKDLTLMPVDELSIDVGSTEVQFQNVQLKGYGIRQIFGSSMQEGSFYTDSDLEIRESVTMLGSLILTGGCSFSAGSIAVGTLYLSEGEEAVTCRLCEDSEVQSIVSNHGENVIKAPALYDETRKAYLSRLTIHDSVTEHPLCIELVEAVSEATITSETFVNGKEYQPVLFYSEERNGEGRYSFRKTEKGASYLFYLVSAPDIVDGMITAGPGNIRPFGGSEEDYELSDCFKVSEGIVCKNGVKTVELAYQSGGKNITVSYGSYKDAVEEINRLNEKRDYTITLLCDIPSAKGDTVSLVMPDGAGADSLTIDGNGNTLCFTGSSVGLKTDLILQNICLKQSGEPAELAVTTIKANGCRLVFKEQVTFTGPVVLSGQKGILEIEGSCTTVDTEGLKGSISGFNEVIVDDDFALMCYDTAKVKQTGGNISAVKLGIFGKNAEGRVSFKADRITVQDITLCYAAVKADKDFKVTGITVSESEGNRLVTRQIVNKTGKVTGVYLNISGEVILSERANQIEIEVLAAGQEEEAAVLTDSPAATGLLLNAVKAASAAFLPAPENYQGENPRLVKSSGKIYLYDTDKAPVELIASKDGEETLIGFYTTFLDAVKAVEERKDKTMSYVFLLHEGISKGNAEKIKTPVYAKDILVKRADDAKEAVTLHIANDITLQSDAVFENIVLSPDYGSGAVNISMGKFGLVLSGVDLAEGKKINKITAGTSSAKALEVNREEGAQALEAAAISVAGLNIGEGMTLSITGKATVGTLFLSDAACLSVGGKSSVITSIGGYTAYQAEEGKASLLFITESGEVTIKNEFSAEEGPLCVEKEDAKQVNELSELTALNKILTAEKSAASDFKIISSEPGNGIAFKHEKGLYFAGENADDNGLLQISLQYGEAVRKESFFADWYQAVTEINILSSGAMSYQLTLLSPVEYTRRLDGKYNILASPAALTMPAAGKCDVLHIKGSGYQLCFTGNITVNNSCTFENVDFAPVKVSKGTILATTADFVVKTGKSGVSNLVFDGCCAGTENLMGTAVPTGIYFGNIKGDGKNVQVYLINGTSLQINGNVTGLKGLYLGMDEQGQAAGIAALFVSGKVETTVLGLTGTGQNTLADTRLLVTGKLTAQTLTGQDGILAVKQNSAKDNKTGAVIKGTADIPEGKAMTILVMQPGITDLSAYLKALEQKENPFAENPLGIPLIQAALMSADKIRTARVSISENEELQLTEPENVVYYRDLDQYIKAGSGEDMQIRITAATQNGQSASGYAKSWYEAVQLLNSMGNNYEEYQLELLGDEPVKTGWNSKNGEAVEGKLLFPSKVQGRIIVKRAEGSGASLIYTGEMKLPGNMTFVLDSVPFEQVDTKGNAVKKVITLGSGSVLGLLNESESCGEISKLTAAKGSLILEKTQITIEGKTELYRLYVSSDMENMLTGLGEMKIGSVSPLKKGTTGNVCLNTLSTYSLKKGSYVMTRLSQLTLSGSVEENVVIRLHIAKDPSKISQGENEDYLTEELLLEEEEKVSQVKKLAAVTGNAADGNIILIDGQGNAMNSEDSNCLITESGGLYLSKEAPLVVVSSYGDGTYSEYQGSFRTTEAALQAVASSAKADIALSKNNKKRYELMFIRQPQSAVSFSMPSNVAQLDLKAAPDMEDALSLTLKGNITLKSNTAFYNISLQAVNTKGAPAAASINAGSYQLQLTDTGLSELISLKGGTKGELVVTATEEKTQADAVEDTEAAAVEDAETEQEKGLQGLQAAAIQGFGQITILNAQLTATGNITAQNLLMKNAVLQGKNVTVSKLTKMQSSALCAADRSTGIGKLKLAGLYSLNQTGDKENILSAEQDAKGNSGIQITGKVYAVSGADATPFVIRLCANNSNEPAALREGMVLLTAAVADGDFFLPEYSHDTFSGMGEKTEGYGVYKKGKVIYYGNLKGIEAVLVNHASIQDSTAENCDLCGGSTAFFSMEEAFAEIKTRKDKKAVYTVSLLQDVEVTSSKGAFTAITMPAYAERLTVSASGEEPVKIQFSGNLTLKCNTVFENINLISYKKSGKVQVINQGTLSGGNYELGISRTVEWKGTIQGKTLSLEKGAGLKASALKITNLSGSGEADIYLDRGKVITITGLLQSASIAGDIIIHLDYAEIPNGTKVIEIKSLRAKTELAGLKAEDKSGRSDYVLYLDGRAVYCRN